MDELAYSPNRNAGNEMMGGWYVFPQNILRRPNGSFNYSAYITRSSFSAKPVRSVCNARYIARPLGLANRRPHLQKAVSSTVWAATLSRTRTLTVTMWSSLSGKPHGNVR